MNILFDVGSKCIKYELTIIFPDCGDPSSLILTVYDSIKSLL